LVHDRDLLDRLSAYPKIQFDGTVFRATRIGLDPLAPSLAGGRWAPRDVTPVLYTSLERGALMIARQESWRACWMRPVS
jgi:hypothetical protein